MIRFPLCRSVWLSTRQFSRSTGHFNDRSTKDDKGQHLEIGAIDAEHKKKRRGPKHHINFGRPASLPREGIINDLGTEAGYLGWLHNPEGSNPR